MNDHRVQTAALAAVVAVLSYVLGVQLLVEVVTR